MISCSVLANSNNTWEIVQYEFRIIRDLLLQPPIDHSQYSILFYFFVYIYMNTTNTLFLHPNN
jgi:hypothetical protein